MPKIIGATIAEHRERTRDALFGALARLMVERGFDEISMADLAAEAGIGRTAVYNHFADKEEVLMAFVAHEMTEYMDTIQSSLAGHDDPTDKLRIYIRTQLLTERSYLAAPGPPLKDVISKEAGRKMAEHVRQTAAILTEILQECMVAGIIPDQDLRVVVQLVHGTLTGRRVPAEEPARTHFFESTERFVLRAIGLDVPETLGDL